METHQSDFLDNFVSCGLWFIEPNFASLKVFSRQLSHWNNFNVISTAKFFTGDYINHTISFPVVNTHCHADHITSTGLMKKRLVGLKSAISKFSGASADILLSEGDKITFGKHVRICPHRPQAREIHSVVMEIYKLLWFGSTSFMAPKRMEIL